MIGFDQLNLLSAKLAHLWSFCILLNYINNSLTLIHNGVGNTIRKYKHMQYVIGVRFNLPSFSWQEELVLDGPSMT